MSVIPAGLSGGHAPIDLALLKDDLNILATDTSNDAWLQRQVDGVWARMEAFCSRKLCSPPAPFIDDWGELTLGGVHLNLPPVIAYWPRTTVFLRIFPVASITAVNLNGTDIDAAKVRWDIDSGKLLTFDAQPGLSWPYVWTGEFGCGLDRRLLGERARVSYLAGWETLPADLYQVALGAMQVLWNARQAQLSGVAAGGVTQIDVTDVGSVQFAGANPFVEAAMKRASPVVGADPVLGPWASNLTDYIDWRATIGSEAFPTTKSATNLPPPPPPPGLSFATFAARAIDGTPITQSLTKMPLAPPQTNTGGYWDASAQTFSPPAGSYQFNASLACVSTNNNADVTLLLYRNGAELTRAAAGAAQGTIMTATIAFAAETSGSGVFELYMQADRSDMTVLGSGSVFSVTGHSP